MSYMWWASWDGSILQGEADAWSWICSFRYTVQNPTVAPLPERFHPVLMVEHDPEQGELDEVYVILFTPHGKQHCQVETGAAKAVAAASQRAEFLPKETSSALAGVNDSGRDSDGVRSVRTQCDGIISCRIM